ncbi:MAG: hypothetical protein AAFX53_18920, partial [Bacteroidota bacterium]
IENENVSQVVDAEAQLSNFISTKVHDLQLTFAEQVLILEGSQLGKADCTIPPYVEYENILPQTDDTIDISPFVIRSEIIEWVLNPVVSSILFKTGSLQVVGADFVGTQDLGVYNRNEFLKTSNRFSLDLSNREVQVNLEFIHCTLYSGINISNAVTKDLVFDRCWFGKAIKDHSIWAESARVKGGLKITVPKNKIRNPKKGENTAFSGHINFSYATVGGGFKIEGYNNPNDFRDSITVKGEVELTGLRADRIFLNHVSVAQSFDFSLAAVGNITIYGSRLGSVNGGGVKCDSIFIRGGTFVEKGAFFHKAEINTDLHCANSFFGQSAEEERWGIAVSTSHSTIQNLIFDEGSIVLSGVVDLRNCFIQNKFSIKDTILFGGEMDNRWVAIWAPNLTVGNKANFNPYNTAKETKYKYESLFNAIKKKVEEFKEKSKFDKEYWDVLECHKRIKEYMELNLVNYAKTIPRDFIDCLDGHMIEKYGLIMEIIQSKSPNENQKE